MKSGTFLIVFSLVFLSPLGCKPVKKEATVTKPAGSVVELTSEQAAHAGFSIAVVEAREASDILRLPGTLAVDPRHSWRVSPVVNGLVEEFGAVAHDDVRKGKVLARLRSGEPGEARQSESLVAVSNQPAER